MFEIYGHGTCVYCKRAMNLLDRKGESYVYYDVREDTAANDVLQEHFLKSGVDRTVPQIWKDDEYIGGFDALERHFKK